jgi:predicted enzyme related to lactoylglutathione lyase
MERAKNFYETVFQIELTPMHVPGDSEDLEMWCFPSVQDGSNISGALCKTSDIKPGSGGTLVYFTCEDCSIEVGRAVTAGGMVIQEKLPISEYGFCAVVMDTEGNTVGLHSMKQANPFQKRNKGIEKKLPSLLFYTRMINCHVYINLYIPVFN